MPQALNRTILSDLAGNTGLRQGYPGGSIRPGVLALKGKWICSFLPEVVKRVCKVMPVHVVPDDLISRFTMPKEPF